MPPEPAGDAEDAGRLVAVFVVVLACPLGGCGFVAPELDAAGTADAETGGG